ncbi:MAG: UpxY family transcription antiterminator [Rikenellaceae bacterium]
MVDYSDKGVVWYAMKTTYKKELQAKQYLDLRGIENFIPMQQETGIKSGRKVSVMRPAVHNLIFVKAEIEKLKDVKISLSYLHNRLTRVDEVLSPIIVPEKQMEQFIYAVTNHNDKLTYVDLSKVHMEKGTLVRITDGDFVGFEGELVTQKRKRDRQVYIRFDEVVAFIVEVPANFIEKIKSN